MFVMFPILASRSAKPPASCRSTSSVALIATDVLAFVLVVAKFQREQIVAKL